MTKSFYNLSSLEFMQQLVAELQEQGEPIKLPGEVRNKKVMGRAILELLKQYPDCPLKEADIRRMWKLHADVRKIRRPMKGCEFLTKPFVKLGMPVSKEYRDEIELIRRNLYGVLVSLQSIYMYTRSMLSLRNANVKAFEAFQNDVAEYRKFIVDTAPYSLCPYCKAIDWYQEHCDVCCGTGWVDYRTYDESPEMLRTDKVVAFQGNIIDIPSALEKRQAEKGKRR